MYAQAQIARRREQRQKYRGRLVDGSSVLTLALLNPVNQERCCLHASSRFTISSTRDMVVLWKNFSTLSISGGGDIGGRTGEKASGAQGAPGARGTGGGAGTWLYSSSTMRVMFAMAGVFSCLRPVEHHYFLATRYHGDCLGS